MLFENQLTAKPFSIFDTHAHYDDESFDEIRDELLAKIGKMGVGYIINNSTDLAGSAEKCLEIAKAHKNCYTAIGVHPETVETKGEPLDEERLRALLKQPSVVAVGEIGLDYYWSTDKKQLQHEVFRRQCEIANEMGLPVIVHDREAHGDTLEILQQIKPQGSLHCFSGSVETALEIVKLGMYIGIGGVITFKNARKLIEVAEAVPIEKILLETDAPYLSPVPFRGKHCNSSLIYYTAEKLAEIKGMSIEEVIDITANNAKTLFRLK